MFVAAASKDINGVHALDQVVWNALVSKQGRFALGDYLGVRRQGRLAAMAGERMSLDGYTEISAVCVDAAFRGQGLAAGLTKLLITAIRARAETPFLHVFTSNRPAIALYRTLEFVERREMHLTVLGEAGA